jgi:DNA-binding transcriptional MerR regulator
LGRTAINLSLFVLTLDVDICDDITVAGDIMSEKQTYSIAELAEAIGISPRTIHFYVQKGLIPGVGRQGPRSRYLAEHLYTLLFIRRLQEEARLTLDEIAEVLTRVSPRVLKAVAQEKEQLEVLDLRGVPDGAASEVARLTDDEWPLGDATLGAPPEAEDMPPEAASRRARRLRRFLPPAFLAQAEAKVRGRGSHGGERREMDIMGLDPLPSGLDLLSDLQRLADEEKPSGEGPPDRWVSVPVTDDLLITAKGPNERTVRLLERIAGHIRKILAGHGGKSRPSKKDKP